MEITKEIRDSAIDMAADLLVKHAGEIQEAFNDNQQMLDVGLKIRFTSANEKFKIKTEINFVADRIKDNTVKWWDPRQRQLFDEEPEAAGGGEG